MIFVNLAVLLVGLAVLVKGAVIFVDGSSALARIFRISSLVIGLTIVASGTSMPELAVSTTAAITGADEIALSNVIGSNIFNLLGILGISALLYKLPVDSTILKRDFPVTTFSTLGFLITLALPVCMGCNFFALKMSDSAGTIGRLMGIILLVLYFVYVAYIIFDARKNPVIEIEGEKLPLWKSIVLIILGLFLIIAGGKAVVCSAKNIAHFFGMSETFIGLTIVAVGTSLPELVTSLVAAKKGYAALAIGNAIGSNIFNLLFILGVAATINPLSVNMASIYDLAILVAANAITWGFVLSKKQIGRVEGAIMLVLYVAETAFAIIRG